MTTAATSPASTPMKLTVAMMMIGGTSGVPLPLRYCQPSASDSRYRRAIAQSRSPAQSVQPTPMMASAAKRDAVAHAGHVPPE